MGEMTRLGAQGRRGTFFWLGLLGDLRLEREPPRAKSVNLSVSNATRRCDAAVRLMQLSRNLKRVLVKSRGDVFLAISDSKWVSRNCRDMKSKLFF